MMNKTKVKLLIRARRFIEFDEGLHVCTALYLVKKSFIDSIVSRCIVKKIMKSIKPFATVNFWLYSKGIPFKYLTNKNMRTYRLSWIDSLIEEYSK